MTPPKVESEKCTFCKQHDETLIHLFYECITVREFWDGFYMLWGRKIGLRHLPSAKEILLGDDRFPVLLNFLILVAKRHIYTSRCQNRKPDLLLYKNHLRNVQKLECHIANSKNKMNAHIKKWGEFLKYLV